jgi:hypothetical protein
LLADGQDGGPLPLLPLIAGERVPCVEQLGETHPPIPRDCHERGGFHLDRDAAFGDASAAITPDGKTAYIASSGMVTPINTGTNTAGKPIRLSVYADQIVITPDGKTVYAAAVNRVIPISTATNTPGKPIHIPIRGAHPSAVITP